MKCRFEHDGDCCNSGATQYMCKCKQPCYTIIPITNADRIRAMSDKELASFLADRFANESCNRLSECNMVTATQMEAIRHTWYCCWMDWLEQPAEGE